MYKRTIKYTDYAGTAREEDYFFNISKTEALKMELGTPGGLENHMNRLLQAQDTKGMIDFIDMFIVSSYGEISPDGKYFDKSPEAKKRFTDSGAYDALFTELINDLDGEAMEFIAGVANLKIEDLTATEGGYKIAPKANA